ncbi:hypothetical protein [Candidatus Tisiphia endosymbiont of Nemotelus uliginosus]|uniref:hypothetical protein n=1 Tax=Candidatus Tisiphia endosymbiont of Nemotelus uliginosus TaxID=3077926 RepID=UPI0035C8E29C
MLKYIKNIKKQLNLLWQDRDLEFEDIIPREITVTKYVQVPEIKEHTAWMENHNINHSPEKAETTPQDYYQEGDVNSKSCWNNIVIKLKVCKGKNKIIKKTPRKLDYIETYAEEEFIIKLTSDKPICFAAVQEFIMQELAGDLVESLSA